MAVDFRVIKNFLVIKNALAHVPQALFTAFQCYDDVANLKLLLA